MQEELSCLQIDSRGDLFGEHKQAEHTAFRDLERLNEVLCWLGAMHHGEKIPVLVLCYHRPQHISSKCSRGPVSESERATLAREPNVLEIEGQKVSFSLGLEK